MWDEMYEEFWDKLEHFCAKLCRDESRAEDLTQEVFLKALMNRSLIESFNARQCKAWLFATARNLYCDQVRRAAKERELMEALLPTGTKSRRRNGIRRCRTERPREPDGYPDACRQDAV